MEKMMSREIGSEFHSVTMDNGGGIIFPREGTLTFSGRTAIEAVLYEVAFAKTALLPSYCCDSMIEPFRRAGIRVDFYDVNYEDGMKIDVTGEKADVLLWCNYFGFNHPMPNFQGLVIEDITHSLFSMPSCHVRSDYLVASVRKWEPVLSGGYCSVVMKGDKPPEEFINGKIHPMKLKSRYLEEPDEDKKRLYLSEFKESNKWLAENYSGYLVDSYSREYILHVNMNEQKKMRRRNAHALYEGLSGKVEFLFKEEDMNCPLFVPIILQKDRDRVRHYLSENEIYCPVHWPRPNAECKSNLYDMELSLVCDQRYTVTDMRRIVEVLLSGID